MRYTANGNPVTTFSVATNRRYRTRDGEQREETEWFRVVTWNQLAEMCNQYLTKGRQRVRGRAGCKSDTWTGARTGMTRFTNEINAFEVKFLGGGGMGPDGPERRRVWRRAAHAGRGQPALVGRTLGDDSR